MASKVKVSEEVRAPARVPQPFLRLESVGLVGELPADAAYDLSYLQLMAHEADAWLARALVSYSLGLRSSRRQPAHRAPTISVLNRRRRSARLWVNAILAGDVSGETLRSLTHTWLPQLAGTGPDLTRAGGAGRALVEYLRGAFTAQIFACEEADLLRQARALHALEVVLGSHLASIDWVTAA